ncbi:MAG: biotin/lipoyl-containing protein [Desulfomonilia bacterium]|nr:biotin/lipoyl-containing protein [Desulfomonilia bacterium]
MQYRFKVGEETLTFVVDPVKEHHLKVSTGERTRDVHYSAITDHHVHCVVDGVGMNVFITGEKGEKTILIRGVPYVVQDADMVMRTRKGSRDLAHLPRSITPPMPSVVVRILVAQGDIIQKGDGLIVLTAMKMETTLTAPFPGRVAGINVSVGEKVMPGKILVELEREPGDVQ